MKELLERKNIRRMLWYALYMFVTLIMQNMFLGQVKLMGVSAMFLPAAVVAVAMFEGATYGAVFGLVMGIFADMGFVENTVMFTLLFPVLAFGVGFVAQFFITRNFVAYLAAALAAIAVTAAVQALKVLAMDSFSLELLETAALQIVWSMPMAAVLYIPPARWIE